MKPIQGAAAGPRVLIATHLAVDGIVLQHVSHIFGIDEGIIDGDNLDVVTGQDGPAKGEEWRQGSQTRVPTLTALTTDDQRGVDAVIAMDPHLCTRRPMRP